MDKLKKLKPPKYPTIGVVGFVLLLTGMGLDSSFIRGIAYYFLAWSIFGDILNGVQWHKHTTINTKNVDYYHVPVEEPERAEGEE